MRGRGKSQGITWGLILVGMLATPIWAQKFYPDDPLEAEPPPLATPDPGVRGLSDLLEFFSNTFTSPGERHPEIGVIPAGAVNTLGEVMDSSWYATEKGVCPGRSWCGERVMHGLPCRINPGAPWP